VPVSIIVLLSLEVLEGILNYPAYMCNAAIRRNEFDAEPHCFEHEQDAQDI
jgi:hypothetical protein